MVSLFKTFRRSVLPRLSTEWHLWESNRRVMLLNGSFAYEGDVVLRRWGERGWEYASARGQRVVRTD